MDFFTQPKNFDLNHQELDGLQKYHAQLLAEKEILETDLKGYETEGYEQFKKVLAKEKVRIAMVRMTVATGEIAQHDQLRGQFFEVELLERNKENVERDIAVNARKISELVSKIEKLKKQLEKQIRK
jgi:hypothetical protein